jgi:hypothetical protein
MRKPLLILFIFTLIFAAYSQDSFSGKYYMENQAEYDTEKNWIEITRNKYQEIIINTQYLNNLVAYYDEDNNEIYYVQEKHAQFNSFMKIKILSQHKIELYVLVNNRWKKNENSFVRLKK